MSKTNPRRANGHRRNQLRARVLAAYDTCHICGQPVNKTLTWPHPYSPVVDEVIPISKGGTLTFSNSRLAHNKCNRIKSNQSLAWARRKLANSQPADKKPLEPRNTTNYTTSTW